MAKKKSRPYANEPHVRVHYAVWDMEPPTPDSRGKALVPQSLIDKHGLQAAFLFTSGFHHRYMGLVEHGPFTVDGEAFKSKPA
jgi:hypothetical protein